MFFCDVVYCRTELKILRVNWLVWKSNRVLVDKNKCALCMKFKIVRISLVNNTGSVEGNKTDELYFHCIESVIESAHPIEFRGEREGVCSKSPAYAAVAITTTTKVKRNRMLGLRLLIMLVSFFDRIPRIS